MGTYEVSVSVSFTASHALPLGDGRMEQSHLHTWKTTATFRSPDIDNEMGVVIDFVDVRDELERIAAELDSVDLNALGAFAPATTSAENVAAHIADLLKRDLIGAEKLYRVSVTEAPGCVAAYYPKGP